MLPRPIVAAVPLRLVGAGRAAGDDGTMAARVGGEKIQKLSRTGQVLAEFPTYVSDGSPAGGPVTQFHGPFDPEISPDGSKIAFEYFNDTYDAAAARHE